MEKEDVLLVANDSILNFPYKIDSPAILFLSKERFSRYLDLMKMKKHLSKTPCFLAEMRGGTVIYYCLDIINEMGKKIDKHTFVRAITLHELYHGYNRMKVDTEEKALFSEALVYKEMKKDFPKEFKFLNKNFLKK